MKILICGGSGLLGSNLIDYLSTTTEKILFTQNQSRFKFPGGKINVDLSRDVTPLKQHYFDVLINCVAMTKVDECETNPQLAYRLNTWLPQQLAKICKTKKSRLVQISTDQVFAGRAKVYREASQTSPINVYGKTKLAGEEMVLKILPTQSLILRTNLFGINLQPKQSLSEWVIDSLTANKTISMFTDVWFNPLLVNSLAGIIHQCITRNVTGIYHCGADDRVSKYQFGKLIKKEFDLGGRIVATSVAGHQFIAPRPRSMYLGNAKLKKVLEIKELSLSWDITKLHQLYAAGYPQRLKRHYDH